MRRCLSRIGSIRLEKLVNGFSRVSLQHSLHSSHDRKFHSIARGVAGVGDLFFVAACKHLASIASNAFRNFGSFFFLVVVAPPRL